MKFRPTPNLLTGIFMGIFSLTTFNVMAEKAVKQKYPHFILLLKADSKNIVIYTVSHSINH